MRRSASSRAPTEGAMPPPGSHSLRGALGHAASVHEDGPVIVDLPQMVNAAGNNGVLTMRERDVNKHSQYARPVRAGAVGNGIRPGDAIAGKSVGPPAAFTGVASFQSNDTNAYSRQATSRHAL